MFNFNCTILDDESASEVCDLLHLPRTAGNIQTVRRGYDIFLRDRVSFDHYSPPDERVYNVKSQGIWHETHRNVYKTSVNGSFLHCTCPQHQNLVRVWQEQYPDLPFICKRFTICKHGAAVQIFEIYQAERAAWSDKTSAQDQAWIETMEAAKQDHFACDGAEVF